jgi:hypothetical protein
LAGLEMKFGLIVAHQESDKPLLYEPYLWSLVFETCVGTFSFLEGLGVALYLNGEKGVSGKGSAIDELTWVRSLKNEWISSYPSFDNDFQILKRARDRIFQNDLSSPVVNDYLDFDAEIAFRAVQRLLNAVFEGNVASIAFLPETTNLRRIE